MSDTVWIALYALGGLVSVPVIARAFYHPDGGTLESSKETAVGLALGNAFLWPFWAVIGLGVLVSRLLTPLIFRSADQEGDK